MRKNTFLAIFAVVGLSAWICLADGKETEEEEMAEEETQPWISPEDSAMFIEVFETYLNYDMDFANSSMKYAESMRKGAGKDYHKSRKHIDSMFHDCIELVKLCDYDIYPESTDSFYMKMFYYCQAVTCRRRNQLCCISAIYLK